MQTGEYHSEYTGNKDAPIVGSLVGKLVLRPTNKPDVLTFDEAIYSLWGLATLGLAPQSPSWAALIQNNVFWFTK